MALIMIRVLSAQDYERLVHNSIYLVHGLDIATELLIKEQDIFDIQANTVELTGALCEVLGRLVMLNELFVYDALLQSIKKDIRFWLYMKERIVYFIERLSSIESDNLIHLIIARLKLWNSSLAIEPCIAIND